MTDQQTQASLVHLINPTIGLRSGVSSIGTASNLLTCELVKPQRFLEIAQRCQNLRFFAVGGRQGIKISISRLFEINTVINSFDGLHEASSSIQLIGKIIENGGTLFPYRVLLERAYTLLLLCTLQERETLPIRFNGLRAQVSHLLHLPVGFCVPAPLTVQRGPL